MLVQSDYHIHASFYRIKAPDAVIGPAAAEQLSAARNAGSCFVGIVEHCNASPKHPFHCLEELSAEYYSPDFDRNKAYLGVEADLADDGSDYCGPAGRKQLKLHYVIGSVHILSEKISELDAYIGMEYRRISNALKYNDNVEIIGHPFGEGSRFEKSGAIPRWSWSLIPEKYLEDILRLASESGKALEINRCDFEDPVYLDFLKRIRNGKIFFSVGSDAHRTQNTGNAAIRTRMLEKLGFTEDHHWRVKE